MILSDYITKKPKALDINEKIIDALDFFQELDYSHFPVLDEGIFIGCANADDMETYQDSKKILDYKYNLEPFFIRQDACWLDVLENFAQNNCNITPVLNGENQYVGFYQLQDVVHFLTNTPFIKEQGGIIIVKKEIKDYSFSQISQILEENNAKVLGLFISNADINEVEITIKISSTSLNPIIQSFRRFNYEIVSEHQEDNYLQNLKERSEYLEKYLNI